MLPEYEQGACEVLNTMMDTEDDLVAQFASITGSDVGVARFYIEASDRNLSQAIESYFGTHRVGIYLSLPRMLGPFFAPLCRHQCSTITVIGAPSLPRG